AGLREGPIAEATEAANAQHYEVPAAFFERVLGPELKYSCALFDPGVARLGDAEAAMLALTCQRAGLEDGMRILELGCGWGSLTLWMARHFPEAEIVALSNSAAQLSTRLKTGKTSCGSPTRKSTSGALEFPQPARS
ncbi:MAG: SAM-dependent methyltransferase, partial [Pseudomonadales bacterium]